jgi:predicted nucleic acid-binding protein
MNVVDSSGWLEYFGGGNNAEVFARVVKKTADLVIPTVSMYEVFKRIASQRDEEEALKAIGLMSFGKVVDLTQGIALDAAVLSMEHKLPMADSIILATARAEKATLWTQDEHFEGLEDVKYIKKVIP